MEYKNYDFGDFPDSLVQLPAGCTIVPLGEMPGGYGQ
jgi:hypothetical protein